MSMMTLDPPDTWEDLIDATEVARMLGGSHDPVSAQTISNLVADKRLRAIRITPKLLRFRRSDIWEYLQEAMTKPLQPPQTTIPVERVLTPYALTGKVKQRLTSVALAETALAAIKDIRVDWGDGSPASPAEIVNGLIVGSHTYAEPGSYQVQIDVLANGLHIHTTSTCDID